MQETPPTPSSSSRKYHHYSTAFHNKKQALQQVSHRATLGFHNLHNQFKARTIDLFSQFSGVSKQQQQRMLRDDDLYLESLFDIVINVHSDKDLMEFVLPTIDAILVEEPEVRRRVVDEVFKGKNKTMTGFFQVVKRIVREGNSKLIVLEAAIKILAGLYGDMNKNDQVQEKKEFILRLVTMKAYHTEETDLTDFNYLRSLLYILKHQQLAQFYYFSENGINNLFAILNSSTTDPQVSYCLVLNLLLLSYVDSFLKKFIANPQHGILKKVLLSMETNYREKVVRACFLLFRKVSEDKDCLQLLIDLDLSKYIENLMKGTLKDKQILELIKQMTKTLDENTKDLNAFEKYTHQVTSKCLKWGSLHSQRFFQDNAIKFELNDFEIVKQLHEMMKSQDIQNAIIACHDLGQFCRFYPNARKILESMGVKDTVMRMARKSQNKQMRQKALITLQKIMVEGWSLI